MQGNKRVSIVTDSAASLPAQLANESNQFLRVVPHRMVINGTTYREGLDLSPEEILRDAAKAEAAANHVGAFA